MSRRAWSSIGVLVLAALPRTLALADLEAVERGRALVRSNDLLERSEGVEVLVKADAPEAIPVLEEAIRASVRGMDRLAKTFDAVDLEYEDARDARDSAEQSGDTKSLAGAERRLGAVKKRWTTTAWELEMLLHIALVAGQGLGQFRDGRALDLIEAGARQEPDLLLRQFYMDALSARRRPESVGVLLDLLSTTDVLRRSAVVRALRPYALDRRVFDAALRAVSDKAWQVRLGAYEVIARAPLDHAIPPLLDAVERESGEPARAVDTLLRSFFGVSFADNPRQWRSWWTENETAVLEGSFLRKEQSPSDARTAETFFSIPIESRNVLFVLDYSGSMNKDLEHTDARNAEVRRRHRLPATRLGVAQAETIRAIRGLPPEARFGLVVFSDNAKRMSDRQVVASESGKSSAIAWLLRQETGWLTNVWDALRVAFGDVYAGGGAARFAETPDTIVFLTDGHPSRGRYQRERGLTDLLRLWNRSLGAAVHTVGVGDEHDSGLLKALADATGGAYLDVRKPSPGRRSRVGIPWVELVEPTSVTVARVRKLLDGPASWEKQLGVGALVRIAAWSRAALALLVEHLDDPDDSVRGAVIDGLSHVPADLVPSTVEHLRSHLERGLAGADTGAAGAIRVIQAHGPAAASAVDALVRIVSSRDSAHRIEAVRALGAIGRAASAAHDVLIAAKASADTELGKAIDEAIEHLGGR